MKRAIIAAIAAAGIGLTGTVIAQPTADPYPARPVRLVVGYAPGGSTDVVARTLAAALTRLWNQQVIVDNRPGADSIIASEQVARSAPDGYTLLLANSANATHPSTQAKLPYDPVGDLTPVAMAAVAKNLLTTSDPKIHSLQDALVLAREKPGSVSYGSGSPLHHLLGELFAQQAGVKLNHVPYKGAAPAITDTLAGHVTLNIGTVASQEPHIRGGKLKSLAVLGSSRTAVFPDVPTAGEAGVGGVIGDYWIGVMGPARMPAALVTRLNADINAVLQEEGVQKRLADLGLEVSVGSATQMGRVLGDEIVRWGNVARDAGIKPQ